MATVQSLFRTTLQRATRPMSRDKADTLLLLGACTLVLAPHAEHVPPWITLACIALLGWRGWITFRGNRMPPRWILVPTAVLAMGGVYLSFGSFFGQDSGVSMLVLLLAFKLLEMHARRDLFVVIFLSFFLILTNFFYSQTIATALLMGVSVVTLLTAQLSFQYTGLVPPFKKRLQLASMIFALALPLMLVMFFLFPRIQGPLWGMPSNTASARSGLSETMAPGDVSNLALSAEVVFRVRFIDPAPPNARLYWRGVVLNDYDGRSWTRGNGYGASASRNIVNTHGTPVRHEITLEPSGRRWLFALETPDAAPLVNAIPTRITSDLQLIAARPITQRVRYTATSWPDFTLAPDATRQALQSWLELPPGFHPKAHAFAADLRRRYPDNDAAIEAVLRNFRQQQFRYTLQPPLLGTDAVDDFLFNTRAGFCEHYASAFVVLMRALDIPARVVTGYQGGEINPIDRFMTIRQSDAHAWAEVWLEKRGWVRIDPTAAVAPNRIERNTPAASALQGFGGLLNFDVRNTSWLAKIRFQWEALNNSWNQWVLYYTPERQRSLLESLGFRDVDWRMLTTLMFALGGTVTALALLPLLLNRRKLAPHQAAYAALSRHLGRRGYPRQNHEGPRAYAGRIANAGERLPADKKSAAMRFLTLYESLQYGTVDASARSKLLAELKSLLTKCR